MSTEPARTYPSDLPVLALRQTVVLPLTLQPLSINRPISIDAVNRALAGDRLVEVRGILNGTCNYILSRMQSEAISFAERGLL